MTFVAIVWMLAASALAQHPDAQAAFDDRNANYSEAEWPNIYYVTLRPAVGDEALDLERAMKLVVAQTSRQPIIERCVPVKVAPGLYRLDLRDLGWRHEDWLEVADHRNPYTDRLPILVRADWLVVELSDMKESDSYHRLLYGKDQPKTRDDILKIFGVGDEAILTWGMIEGQSGVSKQGTRRLESRPIARGYAWGTQDVFKLDTARDPLEHAEGGSPHDGEEWIIGMPKLSTTAGKRGALQAYFLANGKGDVVNVAPVDLVEDTTEFRGYREIRSPGSCIQCHSDGLNAPTRNEFKNLIENGVDVYAEYETRADLESFHLSDLSKEIFRANEDYQTMVELVCGCSSQDAAASFKRVVNRYDAPLDLLKTSEESFLTVKQWTETLALNGDLPARLASLPHGGVISRPAWEEYFVDAMYAAKGQRKILKKNGGGTAAANGESGTTKDTKGTKEGKRSSRVSSDEEWD